MDICKQKFEAVGCHRFFFEKIKSLGLSIYGEEVVTDMIQNGEDIPLHTVKGWSQRGPFRVKKGEHGLETRLWKKRKRKDGIAPTEEDGTTEETVK